MKGNISDYSYSNGDLNHSHHYLLLSVLFVLAEIQLLEGRKHLFELGCGNGSVADYLTKKGWEVSGVDPSIEGINEAKRNYPHLSLSLGSTNDDLSGKFGRFPVVLSLEVVEHVYSPRQYAQSLFSLCDEGGWIILSTPYHGYWKNLAMALFGKMDKHFTALWENGHIKFWSIKTLSILLEEAGFVDIHFRRIGRIPELAMSMIAFAKKP